MDTETKIILTEQQLLSEVLNHSGWRIAERIFNEKIKILSDAFEIDETSPEAMFIDLKARKACKLILEEFLRELKGSQEVVENNSEESTKSFIVNLD